MILHRVMKELEDGSVETILYIKYENGGIYGSYPGNPEEFTKAAILSLKYSRIDRFTGITLNDEAKTKVFERDKFKTESSAKGYVKFGHGKFLAIMPEYINDKGFRFSYREDDMWYAAEMGIKIIGIHGVKEAV